MLQKFMNNATTNSGKNMIFVFSPGKNDNSIGDGCFSVCYCTYGEHKVNN